MIAYIILTDLNGKPLYLKASNILAISEHNVCVTNAIEQTYTMICINHASFEVAESPSQILKLIRDITKVSVAHL